MPRKNTKALQTYRGREAVERIIDHINGQEKIIIATKGTGAYGKPDIKITALDGKVYGCEAKRCQNTFTYKKGRNSIGVASIERAEWERLLKWCDDNNAEPLLLIEVYIPKTRKEHLYFKIKGWLISYLFRKTKNRFVSFTVWDVIRLGEKF